ncbi:MAG: hypothetical protein ACUVXJ_07180 [Phycisphaerae bacterium]
MGKLQIIGLVREANYVRQMCASPMTAAQRQDLRNRVQRTLLQINAICNRHGVRPSQLPAPSRRAYEFLLKLDLDRLLATANIPQEYEPQKHLPGTVRLSGLRAFLDNLLDDLACQAHMGKLDTAAMLRIVQQTNQRLEHHLIHNELKPGHLKTESRDLVAWFRYFAQPENMDRYMEAVPRAQAVFWAIPGANERWKAPLLVHFRPSGRLYCWRVVTNGTRMVLPTPMICFDDVTFGHLGCMMLGNRCQLPAINTAMLSKPYQSIRTAMDEASGRVERAEGMTHNLAEVFDEVNRRYFGGGMARPKLSWTRQLTGRRFGHYNFAHDVVSISSTLDRLEVPRFVIEHVMHHELLHKKHGSRWNGSQRRCHTAEFKAEERTFERFEEADKFLNALSRRMH